ncbi:hypothetical protein G4B88_003579 [Cannabis sativa]|uniref:BHLH domain-containing protein n=1 Tax=Cannabis sativa TaxID=3483 RepID=A0A7J6DLS3_CANSA|nr:hypothetical protein G4B88_003579 [Cannabis sativa]
MSLYTTYMIILDQLSSWLAPESSPNYHAIPNAPEPDTPEFNTPATVPNSDAPETPVHIRNPDVIDISAPVANNRPIRHTQKGFDDLWLLETPISPCDELNVNPIDLQQEVSAFAELLSNINDINGILQQNTKASSHYQDSNFPTIHDPCHETSNIFDVEQGNNICTSYTIPQIDSLSDDKKLKYDDKQLRVQPEVIEDLMVKKQDHNAKEKIRRMKLSETYMALGSLLPTNSRSSKDEGVLIYPHANKKWTAPIIIDEVLEYIPEIEKEIKQLTIKKEDMLSTIENMQSFINKNNMNNQYSEVDFFTISVNEVKKNLEFILQIICMQRDHGMGLLSGLLESMEYEGLFLISASTLHICDERVCYNIHLQNG